MENEKVESAIEDTTKEHSKASHKKTKSRKALLYSIIIVLIAAVAALAVLDYPKISSYIKNKTNPYGFDFNYRKIKAFDWDTILTRKNIAAALNTSRKNINSAKNPDWAWILEDPKQLVDEANCASMLDEKILDQENPDRKNLWNANILLCKNTDETKKTFSSRKDEIKGVSQQDNTVTIKSLTDTKGLGDEGYAYLIEKAADPAAAGSQATGTAAQAASGPQKFAGIVFRRGPFMVMVDESEQSGVSYLSADDMRMKIAQYLDKQLKGLLVWY